MDHKFDNIDFTDDVQIISTIEEHGIAFLEYCYKNEAIYNNHKSIINEYHSQYIAGAIFDNSIINYAVNLNKNVFLWEKYLNECQIDNKIVINLFDELCDLELDLYKKCEIYKNFINLKTEKIIADKIKWHANCKSLQSIFIGQLIELISECDNMRWEMDIKLISEFLKHIMKFINIRKKIIMWFAHILNANIERKNIQGFIPSYLSEDKYMFNITAILYKILTTIHIPNRDNEKNRTYIQVINHEYVYDSKCELIWYDNKGDTNGKYSIITEFFFLLANSVCVSYIPILEYNRILDKYEKQIRNIPEPLASIMPIRVHEQMFKELDKIQLAKKENLLLKQNALMTKWIGDYFSNICSWIYNYKDKKFNVDDILISLLSFVDNVKDAQHSDSELEKLLLDMVGSKSVTLNPDLRVKACKILRNLLKYNFKNGLSFNIESYITNIFLLHNELKNYNREFKDNVLDRNYMYEIVYTLKRLNIENFSYIIDNILSKIDPFEIKNFVNILFNDMSHINESYEQVENILKTENINQNSHQFIPLIEYIASDIHIINCMCKMIECVLVSPVFAKLVSEKDFVILLSPINNMINKLNDCKFNYPYVTQKNTIKINEQLSNICITTINLYTNIFCMNKDSPKIIISSHSNFNIEAMDNLCVKFKNSVPQNFLNFINSCKTLIKLLEEKNNVEYPEEFLDALIGLVVEDPVWVPDTTEDVVLDRSTVTKCLVDKSQNPFTGKQLTLSEFEQYNNTEEIKQRAESFKQKLEEWKQKNLV